MARASFALLAAAIRLFDRALREDRARLVDLHEADVRALKRTNDSLLSQVKLQETELKTLADIIARDRERVRAETAMYGHQIARATERQREAH